MKRLLDWVVRIAFLLSFGLVLLVFDIAGRLARPFSLTAFEWVMGMLQWTLLKTFRLFGTRLTIDRSPAIESRTAYVVVSNHQSLLDVALIGGILLSNLPKYVAKAELGRWIPSVSLNLKWGGHALIDRTDAAQSMAVIDDFGRGIQARRRSAVIFPEGTRSKDGSLQPFKRAGARALLSAADQLPVVPVAIQGSWRLNKLGRYRPGWPVHIILGDPMPRSPDDAADRLREARDWIAARLDQTPAEA